MIHLSHEQDIAATPTENVWVQANAGTGKTRVLVQRLLRILFRSPAVENTGILCLTYTKAGASEMRNRILADLRDWAMADDELLCDLLVGVCENTVPSDDDLAHARRIFFTYIDNPDILKIKTIHGFCEEVLRRFPLEAGISPSWSLVSDYAQRVLLQDTFNRLINSSHCNIDGVGNIDAAFARIVERMPEKDIGDLLSILSQQYKYFFQVENSSSYRKYFVDTTEKYLKLKNIKLVPESTENLKKIVSAAQCEINRTKKPAQKLIDVFNLTKQYIDKTIDFEKYKTIYLTKDGGKVKFVSERGGFMALEQDRVYELDQFRDNKRVFDDTMALFDLSAAFADVYKKIKAEKNLLDFEDLILYTRRLFSNPDTMGWVLSQLNVSLSHILVDEAQDTSPMQWDILRMLAGDFFTDGDTAEMMHSLFVVGDSKQSIYGFQGADPRAFDTSRRDISAHILENHRSFSPVSLAQSFRSVPAVLRAVDIFFEDPQVMEVSGFVNNPHKCFRSDDGLVEIHGLVMGAGAAVTASDVSVADSDEESETADDVVQYVKTLAQKIKSVIDDSDGKISAQDIMVLVQKRDPLVEPLIKELKHLSIDVAGSDRIVLPNFPAVRDLLNLVRFCLNTSDDYSLCCVLKSPIFRLKEHEIFKICNLKNIENTNRKKTDSDYTPITVFEILRETHPDIYADLQTIKSWSETLAPYSFFTNVLAHNNTRDSMVAALGNQITEPLEEFMSICLGYERTQSGTLRHFIKWFITGSSEVKRDIDTATGVRIATVHGSKGLEAPVVFLIDTLKIPNPEKLFPIPNVVPDAIHEYPTPWLWRPQKGVSVPCNDAADALAKTRLAEYYRLLYVAMTRARDRLYIYGFSKKRAPSQRSWFYQLWRVFSSRTDCDVDTDIIRITNG